MEKFLLVISLCLIASCTSTAKKNLDVTKGETKVIYELCGEDNNPSGSVSSKGKLSLSWLTTEL